MAGILYLVPTPIGNLNDISPRCAQTLAEADFIAAEDTRVSLKLLNHLEIKKSLVSYHEHNKAESGSKILVRLLAGETCALVTDAGSPAISDPGEDLVRLCAENGVTVCAIPGPCALVTALSISGLPTGRFTFEGFLSVNKKKPSGTPDGLKGRDADDDLLRSAAQAARYAARSDRCVRRRQKDFPMPGVDEAARGSPPYDAGRGIGILRRKPAARRVCARCGRRRGKTGSGLHI